MRRAILPLSYKSSWRGAWLSTGTTLLYDPGASEAELTLGGVVCLG